MQEIINMIRPELFIIAVFLFALGKFLKLYDKFKAEYTIPFILLGTSFVVTVVYVGVVMAEGFNPASIIASMIQSVLIAALAVFGNELIKQAFEKRHIDN